MALAAVSLDDKYELESGRVYLSGIQALVRLPMMQRRRDEAAGLNTGCFISGYRGSPLGALDQQLWHARTSAWVPVRKTRPLSRAYLSSSVTAACAIVRANLPWSLESSG